MIFLPLDTAGARALGLPVGSYDEGDITQIEAMIEIIADLFSGSSSPDAARFAALCDRASANVPCLFPPELRDYSPAIRDARRRVRAYAITHAALSRFDNTVIIKSQQTFLSKPEEQLVA